METPPRAEIRQQDSVVNKGKFKVDEVLFAYKRTDGTMSVQSRLVFERGDAAAVLLLNTDTDSVVLVNQFRLPTLLARRRDPGSGDATDGWLTEVVAGMVDDGEKPATTVVRETKEETGYKIRDPKLICTFFVSPGGTSERIFLYFAQVDNAARRGPGGGIGDEEIAVIELPITQLFDQLKKGEIQDPKLAIAAYWLQEYVKQPLKEPKTVQFRFADAHKSNRIIGYKTGAVDDVDGVDVWVNSENTDMEMDRFIGRSVSARIRYLGANKEDGVVYRDTIQVALKKAMGARTYVRIGTVLVTKSGMLLREKQVERIFHVATVEGRPGEGPVGYKNYLKLCVKTVLKTVDEENTKFRIFKTKNLDSILFPMLGAGDGGLAITEVVDEIIPAAIEHLGASRQPTLKEVYFLAFRRLDKCACEEVFKRYCENGTLVRLS
jgi:ADP-ribose pyrophosphatase